MSVTHILALRTDFANLATGTATTFTAGTLQQVVLYAGTPPANASASLSSNPVVSTITALVWGAASSGVATLTSSTADSSAVGGVATFYRRIKSVANGSGVIEQGTVATSAADMIIGTSTTVAAGATVTLTSGTYTASV